MNDRDGSTQTETFVWRYEVKPDATDAFVIAYGRGGDWDTFFSGALGYLGTEFYRDAATLNVYLTVDYWSKRGQRDAYVASRQSEYDALDARCAQFTVNERRIRGD